MSSPPSIDQILKEYRQRLIILLGTQLDSLVLYGSQARGEAGPGSDIDVLCIMKKPFDYSGLIRRTSQATSEISLKYDVVISRVFVTRDPYIAQATPFLMNIHKEQVAV
jgi:predicted nucleotidyltransferase